MFILLYTIFLIYLMIKYPPLFLISCIIVGLMIIYVSFGQIPMDTALWKGGLPRVI